MAFEYLRNKQLDIYSPKLRKKPEGDQIPRPGTGLFGWILPVWKASDAEVLKIAGMDAYVLLRHFKMCYKICLICALGAVVLLGLYYTSFEDSEAHDDDDESQVVGIAQFSMANIPNQGRRLWASVIFVYFYTFVFLYFIDAEYANFALLRAQGGTNTDGLLPPQMAYSVQVENIPADFRTSPALKTFMNSLFPGEVLFTYVAISLTSLEEAVAQRDAMLAKLEDSTAIFLASNETVRPTVWLRNGVLSNKAHGDRKVDAMEFLSDQIAVLSAEIMELQLEAKLAEAGEETRFTRANPTWLRITDNLRLTDAMKAAEDMKALEMLKKVSSAAPKIPGELDTKLISAITDLHGTISSRLISATGFVTFRSKRTQAVAIGLPSLSAAHPDMQVTPAPAPTDIIWENLSASTEHTEAMAYMTSAFYYTGLVFWTVVLTFIAGLSNLSHLAEYMPFLNSLDDTSYAVLQGLLPVLVMMVFLSLVPYAMEMISKHIERRKTISSVQEQVFKWFFLYQIANVYLLLLAGSAVTSVSGIVDNPTNILYEISTALPITSVFFMNYLITTALTGVTMNYLQIVPMLYFAFMRIFYKESRLTRRMLLEGPLAKISVNYGATLPDGLYVLCILLLYWVISPFIIFIALVYFGAAYLCWKYQFLYVIVRTYEGRGKFWYGLYTYSMVALLASTVTMIAYMSIKEGIIQAPCLLPVLPLIMYQWRRTEGRYKAQSLITPYSTAVDVDMADSSTEAFEENYLKQPCIIASTQVSPYPYRIRGLPLLDERGLLNEVYLDDDPPEDALGSPIGPSGPYNPPKPPTQEVLNEMHADGDEHKDTELRLGPQGLAAAAPGPVSRAASGYITTHKGKPPMNRASSAMV